MSVYHYPDYFIIHIGIFVRDNIPQSNNLIPRNLLVMYEQRMIGLVINRLYCFANYLNPHYTGIKNCHSPRRSQEVISRTEILTTFLHNFYRLEYLVEFVNDFFSKRRFHLVQFCLAIAGEDFPSDGLNPLYSRTSFQGSLEYRTLQTGQPSPDPRTHPNHFRHGVRFSPPNQICR